MLAEICRHLTYTYIRIRSSSGKVAWYRRTWFIGVVAGIVGLLIGVGSAGASKGTSTKTVSKTVAGAQVTVSKAIVQTSAGPTVTARPTKTVQMRVTYTPQPSASASDGTFLVGTDITAASGGRTASQTESPDSATGRASPV
jgi:hypothetical protein